MRELRHRLDEALVSICSIAPTDGVAQSVGEATAADLIRQHLGTGGKRLRGLLPVALVEAEGGPADVALRYGAAVEAVHNGTLVHDDIQDRDTLRRGKPTLWTEVGVAQAINAADVLLIAPIHGLLADRALPDPLARQLAVLLAGALVETIRGQIADVDLRDLSQVGLDTLSAIACAKTSPLFAAALQGSVHIIGGSDDQAAAARKCGHRLGLAFQIRDDLLDAMGTKGRGDPGADLREGKPTWPVLAAFEGADQDDVVSLRELLAAAAAGSPPDPAEVRRWVQWTADRGGVQRAQAALSESLKEAENLANTAFPRGSSVVAELCSRLASLDG